MKRDKRKKKKKKARIFGCLVVWNNKTWRKPAFK